MTNEELISAFRGVVREEVNAGVYASEQRMTEKVQATEQRLSERLDRIEEHQGKMEDGLDKVGKRLEQVEQRQGHLEGMVLPMAEHLKLMRTDLREVRNPRRNDGGLRKG